MALDIDEWRWDAWTNVLVDNKNHVVNLVYNPTKGTLLVFVPIEINSTANNYERIIVSELDDEDFIKQCSEQGFQKESLKLLKEHLFRSIYERERIASFNILEDTDVQLCLELNQSMSVNLVMPMRQLEDDVLIKVYQNFQQYLIKNMCLQNMESSILKRYIKSKDRTMQYISDQVSISIDEKDIIKKWIPPGSIYNESIKPLSQKTLENKIISNYQQHITERPTNSYNEVSEMFKRFQLWTNRLSEYKECQPQNSSNHQEFMVNNDFSSFDENLYSTVYIDGESHSVEDTSDTDVSDSLVNNINEKNSFNPEITPVLQQTSRFSDNNQDNSGEIEAIYCSPKKRRVFGKVRSQN